MYTQLYINIFIVAGVFTCTPPIYSHAYAEHERVYIFENLYVYSYKDTYDSINYIPVLFMLIYAYTYMPIYLWIYKPTCLCIWNLQLPTYMFMCLSISVYRSIYSCTSFYTIWMCIYSYVCIYTNICMYVCKCISYEQTQTHIYI